VDKGKENPKEIKEKSSKDLKSIIIDKILELQGSSLSPKEQIGTFLNFCQSVFQIETIATYANFASEEINLISSKGNTKQHSLLGHMIENIANHVNLNDSRYYNSLVPLSELNIQNLAQIDLNTFVYPIVSPHAKQIYGVVVIVNPRSINTGEVKNLFLFVLNYITKIIEEADLSAQITIKSDRLRLVSRLSNSLRANLKADKAVDVVLKEIHGFLKLEDIYFAGVLSQEKRFEVVQEIVISPDHSLKGFIHKLNMFNPIIKLLYKNQFLTYKNKNVRRFSKVFLKDRIPSVFAIIPVFVRNELLGLIVCVSTSPYSLTSTEDMQVTQDIAGHLAVVLNKASLYEESLSTAQREFLLNSITTMIRDTLEVKGVLEKTAREVGQVFGVDACGAFLQREGESTFASKSIWAVNEKCEKKLAELPVLTEGSPLLPDPITQSIAVSNLGSLRLSEFKKVIDKTECKSYLACSLNKGNKVIGIIALAHFEHERMWTTSEVQLLEAITDQVEMALTQAELHEHVQQTERQMNLLHQVSSAIRDSLNLSTVMATTASDLGEILQASRCFIRRLRSVNPLVVLATEQEYLNKEHKIGRSADLILEFEKKWLESLNNLPEVERANSILHILDVSAKYKDVGEPLKTILNMIQVKSFLAIPLVAVGQVIGTVCIHQCDRHRKFTQNEIEFVKRVASEASVAVLNADLFAKVQHQAQRDGLTKLYNHAYFQTALHHEVERAKRTGSELSVIMVDLDHLKPINDKFGHKAGDEAIILVAGKLQQCLRQMDIISRYGGDEFAVLLPETNVDSAELIAKRILEALNRTIHPQWGPLSASIGVSGTPHEERNKESIMKAADDVMYVSKKEGRNRVTPSKKLDEIGSVEKKPLERE